MPGRLRRPCAAASSNDPRMRARAASKSRRGQEVLPTCCVPVKPWQVPASRAGPRLGPRVPGNLPADCVVRRQSFGWPNSENRAIGEVWPADDILNAIEKDRARCLKQRLVCVGVELAQPKARARGEPAKRIGQRMRQTG